mgnify:CR=1 FL=1|tara:strand:+ start:284 stop:553 length:270 start_codon:yes stop_codon:yes gene_type:complete
MKLAYLVIITRNLVNNKITNNYQVKSPIQYNSIAELNDKLLDFYISKPKGSLQQFKGSISVYTDKNLSNKLFSVNFNRGSVVQEVSNVR